MQIYNVFLYWKCYLFWAFPYFPNGSPAIPPSPVKMYKYPSSANRSCPPLWFDAGSSISKITLEEIIRQKSDFNSGSLKCFRSLKTNYCLLISIYNSGLPLRGVIHNVHVIGWNMELADPDPFMKTHFHCVIHIQLPVVLVLRVKSEAQKASLITFPWWR